MAAATVIGGATFVRGRLEGTGDLEIAGRVEGDIACSGEVLLAAGSLVDANVSASRIVVRGAVKGDLVAEEAIVIESGGRVVGDLRAPRVAIVQGGLVRGQVQTGAAGAPTKRASTTASAARPADTKSRQVAIARAPEKAAPASRPAAPPAKANSGHDKMPRGATLAGARIGPPPPVVPVLKKGTKAVQKKRG